MSPTLGRDRVDRSMPPAAGSARNFRFPAFDRSQHGALELLLLERRDLPIVGLSLIAPQAGGASYPTPAPGLAAICAACLTEGTHTQTAVEFADRAEQFGGFVSSSADWDSSSLHAGALSEHIDGTLEILSEAFLESAFRDEDVERLRTRRLSELARRSTDPSSMASVEFLRSVYGDSIYGRQLIGDRSAVMGLEHEAVEEFWYDRSPRQAALVVAGDFDSDHIRNRVERTLGPLIASQSEPQHLAPISALVRDGLEIRIVDRPYAAQTQLVIGHEGPGRVHPDRPVLRLLNAIVGGKFSSRINLNLREKHGFTYGASSSFSGRSGPGPFVIQTAVENHSVGPAVEQVIGEIERIRSERVPNEEVDSGRRYLMGIQPYPFQSISGWVSALAVLATYGLPDDWYQVQHEALLEVGAADLQRAALEHLQPDRLVVVAVGPAEQIAGQFESFDQVSVLSP